MSTAVAVNEEKPLAQVPVQNGVSPMVQMFASGQYDAGQIEKLIELQERFEANEARKAFMAARAMFRKLAPVLKQDSVVDFTHNGKRTYYKFTSLGYGMSEVNPVLGQCGLDISWGIKESDDDKMLSVTAILCHELGHSETVTLSSFPDEGAGKSHIQAKKSAISYLERITAFALLGLASSYDDNDGRDATTVDDVRPPPEPTFNEGQKAAFDKALKDGDSVALYTMARIAKDSRAWKDLYNSGVDGQKVKVKSKVDELEAKGREICEQTATQITEAHKNDSETAVLEYLEDFNGREIASVLHFCDELVSKWATELVKNQGEEK